MRKSLSLIDELQAYFRGVMDRINHHAAHLADIVGTILAELILKKDGVVQVMTRNGDVKNVLWLAINNRPIALSYDHRSTKIVVREGTMRGKVLASFDNNNTSAQVRAFFDSL